MFRSPSRQQAKSWPGNDASRESTPGWWIAGVVLGAALMYFLDPQAGRRRRARMHDQLVHARSVARSAGRASARDLAARSAGTLARLMQRMRAEPQSERRLTDRVRSSLGRAVSHPHSVQIAVDAGRVRVSGPVLGHEVERLLACIRSVPGVHSIDNRLQVHAAAGSVPGLQGGSARTVDGSESRQTHWSPAVRLLAGTLGTGLITRAVRMRGPAGWITGVAASALLLRAASNRAWYGASGASRHEREIEIRKSILIEAPVTQVFAFWRNIRNFPSVMTRVRDVRELDDSRSYWRASGPGAVAARWTAEVTRLVPEKSIEWRCDDRAALKHRGRVRFEADGEAATRVHVQLHYAPPGGALGHMIARLFSVDPKSGLDADLLRMKTLLETGNRPHAPHGERGGSGPTNHLDADATDAAPPGAEGTGRSTE